MGRTLAELGAAMPAEEFQGHLEDLGLVRELEPEPVPMTENLMGELLGIEGYGK